MLRNLVLILMLFSTCGIAAADEASVKKLVEAKLGTKVQSVVKTPYGGLYEVYVDKNILKPLEMYSSSLKSSVREVVICVRTALALSVWEASSLPTSS